ncbi:uncharacterized protein LOC135165938 isoform X2 [Diachasmimorpha longicaudata]|uniref:uncharacterized protein LOC135165938 isoform X2 n=1 Tax=Diachasmimorpha longicaudata TaxID=58733 RepID=UPI0030B8812B
MTFHTVLVVVAAVLVSQGKATWIKHDSSKIEESLRNLKVQWNNTIATLIQDIESKIAGPFITNKQDISKMQDSLNNVKVQLENAHTIFIKDIETKKAEASAITKSTNAELTAAFAEAWNRGNICTCTQPLNLAIDTDLKECNAKIDACTNKYMPNFVEMKSKIDKIIKEGEELRRQLEDISQRYNKDFFNTFVWMKSTPGKVSWAEWQARARAESKPKGETFASARNNISQCVSPLLVELMVKVKTATHVASQCILTL